MAITLGQKLTYQASISPIFRNSNLVGAKDRLKAGPNAIVRLSDTLLYALVEAHGASESGNTNWVFLYQSTDRGQTWTQASGVTNPVFSPEPAAAGWENGEVCAYSLVADPDQRLWKMWYHGGNNSGVRKVGYATSPINLSLPHKGLEGPWTKSVSNPVLSPSAFGTADDDFGIADECVLRLSATDYRMWYRGIENAGSAGSPVMGASRIFYATSTDGIAWTKNGAAVLTPGSSGAWDDLSVSSPWVWQDTITGRFHMVYTAAGTDATQVMDGIGYAHSDDGITWAKSASNPVAVGTGVASDYHKSIGDTAAGWLDSDVVFYNFGADNLTGLPAYNGDTRFEGRVPYFEPRPTEAPARGARFFRNYAGSAQQYSALPTTFELFNHNALDIILEFKCPKHNTFRYLFYSDCTFREGCYIRLNTTGIPQFYFRSDNGTTAVDFTLTSGSRLDDNRRRWARLRRTASNAFEVFVGDETGAVSLGTSSVTPTLKSGASVYSAFGNAHLSSGGGDFPAFGSLGGAIIVLGGTIATTAEVLAWFNNRTVPTPSGGTLHRWQLGGSSTTTEDDLGAGTAPLTHNGLSVRTEWTPQADLTLSNIKGGGYVLRRRRRDN